MCTAITFHAADSYFGRNLDYEQDFGEQVVITPRNYPLLLRSLPAVESHYAIIGMAVVDDGYPLYFDATNEKGLSMAGLNFPNFACYHPFREHKKNVTPFEFIPFVLGQCENTQEAIHLLENVHLVDIPYSDRYPLTPLHWIIADSKHAITVEPLQNGIECTANPVGVLTNSPPFAYHMHQLSCFMNLSPKEVENRIAPSISLKSFSRGMGAYGLPGDLSSPSRFVRAAFHKLNATPFETESKNISQFFHILDSVAQIHGSVKVNGDFERTIYSSCCNINTGVYYYKTYTNFQPTGIRLWDHNLDSTSLSVYSLNQDGKILMEKCL